jgi:hypothetical protein
MPPEPGRIPAARSPNLHIIEYQKMKEQSWISSHDCGICLANVHGLSGLPLGISAVVLIRAFMPRSGHSHEYGVRELAKLAHAFGRELASGRARPKRRQAAALQRLSPCRRIMSF